MWASSMLQQPKPTLFHLIQEYTNSARDQGIDLEIGGDFEHFKELTKRQPERNHVNPAFDPNHCDLPEGSAYWIVGYKGDEIVHTQAIKLLDTGGQNFEDYLARQYWDFRSYGYDLDKKRTSVILSPEAKKMSGRITYHGELWLKGGPNGIRGGSTVVLLTRLMMLHGLMHWAPDFMIGLQSPMTTCRGLAAREGYMRMEQQSLLWYQKASSEPMEDWLVWMSKEDAEFNLRLPASFFMDLLDAPKIQDRKIASGS